MENETKNDRFAQGVIFIILIVTLFIFIGLGTFVVKISWEIIKFIWELW